MHHGQSTQRFISFYPAYIDDIVVTGTTEEEHLKNLDEVLGRLGRAGARLKKSKCRFLAPQIEYLGHLIDAEGLHQTPAKVKAIMDAPAPQNITEVRSFLGLVNYYGNFVPNLSSNLCPLYSLLQKTSPWSWSSVHEECFKQAKRTLSSPKLLVHYDPEKKLSLACDASPYGIGAVLTHQMKDGSEQPISLCLAHCLLRRRNTPKLTRKPGLSIIFGVTKFHQYLYGRSFTLFTDHKPLTHLFHPSKAVPQMASGRIQRWGLMLSGYSYQIEYKKSVDHANADALSHLPLPCDQIDAPILSR